MTEKDMQKSLREHRTSLQAKRRRLLTLPAEEALSAILEAKNPAELVHAFPEEDFYFLVKDIGADDALPILALASASQLEYLLDIDLWKRDRIDLHAAVKWIDLLMKADPRRLTRWLADEKTDFLEFLLSKNVEVRIREQDQSPSDFGQGFVTFDDVFYFRVAEDPTTDSGFEGRPAEKNPQGEILKDREAALIRLLNQLADIDHNLYHALLLESAALLSVEAEEELYRLRNVRLAEKGFLPFEESIGVYQPLQPGDIHPARRKIPDPREDDAILQPVPFVPHQLLLERSVFAEAMRSVKDETVVLRLQSEFAGLCNQLMVADRKGEVTRDSLRDIVQKACRTISIGLENLPGSRADLISDYSLADLFKVGYGFALRLKWKAEKWRDRSWFAARGLPLSFWGEEWLGVIGGLLLKRPLYFDNYKTGVLYRDFADAEDIRTTESALEEIAAFDDLLSHLPVEIDPPRALTLLNHKNLVLTLWARSHLNLDRGRLVLEPISLKDFRTFFNDLWRAGKPPRSVKTVMKQAFLKWLTQASGLSGAAITQRSGKTLERLFLEIENEYGRVPARALDPRFIPHFLLKR